MSKVVIENLTVRYSDDVESLRNISLAFVDNAVNVLFGPAGGGKSTLLRTLNRLNDLGDVKTVTGKVLINGENILDPKANVIELRRKVGIVFSRPIPLPLTIYENVAYGLQMAGEKSKAKLDMEVERALRQAVLWDEVHDRLHTPANDLSGGQKQRLCLARSLVLKPEIMLLDEPTSALDPVATARIESLLQDLKESMTIIIAPHNTQQSARVADYAAFFLQGELIEADIRDRIFVNPRDKRTDDYVRGKFG